jgi:hypothetical protein
MDIRITGFYERMLEQLQEHDRESASTVVRTLIRERAQRLGLWPEVNGNGSVASEPAYDGEEAAA